MMGLRLVVSAWLGGVVVLPAASARAADLRPKFEKDRVTFYRRTMATDQTMEMPGGQRMAVHMDLEMGMSLKVTDLLADGKAKLDLVLLYLKMKNDMAQMPMDFDTRDAESLARSPIGNMFEGFLNTPVTATVSTSGALESVEGFEKMGAAMGFAGRFMEQVFSEDAVRQMPFFPAAKAGKNPTPVGYKWKDQFEISLPMGVGMLVIRTDYELGSVDDAGKVAEIPFVTHLSLKERDPAATQPAGMYTFEKAEGRIQGTIRWDFGVGELLGSRGEQTMEMEAVRAGTQSIKQTIGIVSVIERVDKEAMKLKTKPAEAAPKTTAPAEQEGA